MEHTKRLSCIACLIYDHLLGRRRMSSKTGASGSYLSTPMDVSPPPEDDSSPSGYGDRVGELRVDPGAI